MTGVALLLGLGAALCWSLGMVIAKLGVHRMGVVAYGLTRWSFALLFIVPYGIYIGQFQFDRPGLIGMAALAGFLDAFLGGLVYLLALKKSPAHRAITLTNTAPFWGVVAAILFLGEPARMTAFFAAILVVLGAYFLVVQNRNATFSSDHSYLGSMYALLAAIIYAVAELVPTKYCLDRGMPPLTLLLIFTGTAVVSWGLVATRLATRRRLRFSKRGVGAALLAAFSGSFLGWTLWLSSLQRVNASLLAPVRGSVTLFAFLFSVLLLRERPTIRALGGFAFVFGGVLLISLLGS